MTAPGRTWELQLDRWHDAYRRDRRALILRAHPPVKILARKHDAHFYGVFSADGPPDYYGIVAGVPVVFDAKDCEGSRFPFSQIAMHQARDLEAAIGHGAKAAIALRLAGARWWVPWDEMADAYWKHAEGKALRGEASLTVDDLARIARPMREDGWIACL